MAEKKFEMQQVNIKGKQYTQVHERLKYFRLYYPDHDINSEIFFFDGKQCVISYKITSGSPNSENYRVHASGHAHEIISQKGVNATSFVENCDTSALGRCLANFGIGIDHTYASADEVRGALGIQEESEGGNSNSGNASATGVSTSSSAPYRGPKKTEEPETDPFI